MTVNEILGTGILGTVLAYLAMGLAVWLAGRR